MAILGEQKLILKQSIDRARLAAAESDKVEPRAESVYYDANSQKINIYLRNGVTVLIPVDLLEGLANASPIDLADVEVTPSGAGLYWKTLDVDLSVPALLMGVFGTKAWMKDLERQQVLI